MSDPKTTGDASIDTRRSWLPDNWRQEARGIGVSIGIGVLLAVSGAFGTLDTPLWLRLVYWVSIMVIGSMIGSLVSNNIVAIERKIKSVWLVWLLVTLVVGIAMAPIVWGIGVGLGWAEPDIRLALFYLLPSFMISGLMAGIGILLNQVPPTTHGPKVGSDEGQSAINSEAARPIAFLQRLPARLFGAEMIAVEAQDHYLKVHTSRGSEMILMRLSDAVKELEGIEGAQVHRSWWVAKAAVEGAERGNGRATLRLTGGIEAPVSRSYARALREDGWF